MNSLRSLLRLIRPYQWTKNVFVFMALIFGGRLLDFSLWIPVIVAALSFCLCSSAIYCLNDIIDAPADRLDPVKCRRPVASGAVSTGAASATAVILAAAGMGISIILLPLSATIVLVSYLVLNLLYCMWLKNIPLVDVITVSIGFVLRVVMGGVATGIWISQWIVIMVFLLALFLALAKRRHEVVLVLSNCKEEGRPSIHGYTVQFLDMALCLLGSVTVIGYIIYTLQPRTIELFHTPYLYITALPVVVAILRYIQLTVVDNASGDPSEIIFRDRALRVAALAWILTFGTIIYLL